MDLQDLSASPWRQFTHPAVRDLAWSLLAPPLLQTLPDSYSHIRINHFSASRRASVLHWLQVLQQQPAALEQWLQHLTSGRIGHYFEALWQFYLTHRHHLLAANVQVRAENITCGEIDAIYRDSHSGELRHAELAVKFYLGWPGAALTTADDRHWHPWLGPDSSDRLDLKLHAMLERQLALGQTALTAGLLDPDLQRQLSSAPLIPELILRGRLFYPWGDDSFGRGHEPLFADPHHERGYWCYTHQLPQVCTATTHLQWLPLTRQQWLAPVDAEVGSIAVASLAQVLARDAAPEARALLFAGGECHGRQWRERVRLVVVNDSWPDRQR